jgi:hypothetical protein
MTSIGANTPAIMRVWQYFVMYTYVIIGVLLLSHRYLGWAITSLMSAFGYDSATVFGGDASAFSPLKDPSLDMAQYFEVFHVVVYLIIVINIAYVAVQLIMLRKSTAYYIGIVNLFVSKRVHAYVALGLLIYMLVEFLSDPAEMSYVIGMKLLFHYHPYIYLFVVLAAIHTALMGLSPTVIAAILAFMRRNKTDKIS